MPDFLVSLPPIRTTTGIRFTPLGSAAEVRARLESLLPWLVWREHRGVGLTLGTGHGLTIRLDERGTPGVVSTFTVPVESIEAALPALQLIVDGTGWSAVWHGAGTERIEITPRH